MTPIFRTLICVFFFGFAMASHIEKQNELTALQLKIPKIAKEVRILREENRRLQYEIGQFESPEHLLALAPKYSRLKHPLLTDIITLKEGIALNWSSASEEGSSSESKAKVSLAAVSR